MVISAPSNSPGALSVEKQERLARVYDSEILPLYGRRFAQLALRALDPRPAASVLEIGCATGDLTLELSRRLDEASRIVALELSLPLLAQAQSKLAADPAAARKIQLQQTQMPLHPTLVLPDSAFDLCVSNLGIADAPEPRRAVAELASMLKPGGELLLTLPLRGTWGEFLDIYREVLREHDKPDRLAALDGYIAALPDGDQCAGWLEDAGLYGVELTVDRWQLLFKSAREFFYAPVIHLGPLSRWKRLAGGGDEMQDGCFFAKEAIDAYFAGGVFSVTVVGAVVKGWKKIPPS